MTHHKHRSTFAIT